MKCWFLKIIFQLLWLIFSFHFYTTYQDLLKQFSFHAGCEIAIWKHVFVRAIIRNCINRHLNGRKVWREMKAEPKDFMSQKNVFGDTIFGSLSLITYLQSKTWMSADAQTSNRTAPQWHPPLCFTRPLYSLYTHSTRNIDSHSFLWIRSQLLWIRNQRFIKRFSILLWVSFNKLPETRNACIAPQQVSVSKLAFTHLKLSRAGHGYEYKQL